MKRICLWLALIAACLPPDSAFCGDVAVIQSRRLPPFDLVRTSFAEALGKLYPARATKTINAVDIDEYVLSDFNSPDELYSRLAAAKPRGIFAIGPAAVEFSQRLKEIPIVYALVPSPTLDPGRVGFVTGVSLETPPEVWLDAMARLLPGKTKIGVVTRRVRGDAWLGKAELLARARGFDLLTRHVDGPGLHKALESLIGNVDTLWLLPGPNASDLEAVEYLLTFAMKSRLPVISFQESHLKLGAAVALAPDIATMGVQAAELLAQLAGTARVSLPAVAVPRGNRLTINATVFDRLGIRLVPGIPDYREGKP